MKSWAEENITCENGYSAHLGRPIISPACHRGKATHLVTIDYGHEADTLKLCDECRKIIVKDAHQHGYKVSSKRIT